MGGEDGGFVDCAGVGFGAEDVGGVERTVVGEGFVEGSHEGVSGAYTGELGGQLSGYRYL